MSDELDCLSSQILLSAKSKGRYILGLTGSPAAGKSTLAEGLVDAINILHPGKAIVLPMDGYHLPNAQLEKLGLLELKGIPQSFDADAFVGLVESLKSAPDQIHFAPEFQRVIEASIENAIEIKPQHEIIITEGNYLLLELAPWNQLREYFDEVWFLSLDEELRIERLLARHIANGRTREEALEKMQGTDSPNAELIEATKSRADRIVQLG